VAGTAVGSINHRLHDQISGHYSGAKLSGVRHVRAGNGPWKFCMTARVVLMGHAFHRALKSGEYYENRTRSKIFSRRART
jgi:hypothetical protein